MRNYLIIIILFINGAVSAQNTYIHYPDNVDAPLNTKEVSQLEEVYGDNLSYLYERPQLLRDIKDYLRNRVKIMHISPEKAAGSRILNDAINLNSVALYDVFNQELSHDYTYNKNIFNLLKYKIPLFPSEKILYKLGDYYITISPQVKKERN